VRLGAIDGPGVNVIDGNVSTPDSPKAIAKMEQMKWAREQVQKDLPGQLQYPKDATPSHEAIAQSNEFAQKDQLREALKPGFRFGGSYEQFDEMGRPLVHDLPIAVYDPEHDPMILRTKAEAHVRFDGHQGDPIKLTEMLAKYSKSIMMIREGDKGLVVWGQAFERQHAGETIPIGEYIRIHKGRCFEQSMVLKILADEFGLDSTLVVGRGAGGNLHSWIILHAQGGDYIFDPRQQLYGAPPAEHPEYHIGALN
jgi:hypothetical protein